MNTRRRLLAGLASITAGLIPFRNIHAESEATDDMRFPGDPTDHNVVFQFNKADQEYHDAVLFAVGEMLRKYGDNITIVVTAFGPGIHVLGLNPRRYVSPKTRQKIKSLADYGVKFHACGNTMNSLGWTEKDIYPFAEMVKVGAADIMELQEKGYSYLSW
ncbi:MAG: DsrE family protein [Gammaproteobacteria bacterium]|nr:DsrE family protein [Gammaproteobacteria bacterium]